MTLDSADNSLDMLPTAAAALAAGIGVNIHLISTILSQPQLLPGQTPRPACHLQGRAVPSLCSCTQGLCMPVRMKCRRSCRVRLRRSSRSCSGNVPTAVRHAAYAHPLVHKGCRCVGKVAHCMLQSPPHATQTGMGFAERQLIGMHAGMHTACAPAGPPACPSQQPPGGAAAHAPAQPPCAAPAPPYMAHLSLTG